MLKVVATIVLALIALIIIAVRLEGGSRGGI